MPAPSTSSQLCNPAQLLSAVENMQNDHYAFVSHSLGSRIVIDGLQRIARLLSDEQGKRRMMIADEFVKTFRQLQFPIFMLSNQLPLLQLGRELPEVTAYCNYFVVVLISKVNNISCLASIIVYYNCLSKPPQSNCNKL